MAQNKAILGDDFHFLLLYGRLLYFCVAYQKLIQHQPNMELTVQMVELSRKVCREATDFRFSRQMLFVFGGSRCGDSRTD
jgi:hypothetical protein